ncbi:MAG: hypothetical protein WAL26_23420 [Mycobacterium sp.]
MPYTHVADVIAAMPAGFTAPAGFGASPAGSPSAWAACPGRGTTDWIRPLPTCPHSPYRIPSSSGT